MAQTIPVPRLIRELAARYGIDPAAAIAVARGEGGLVNRADDVGDLAGGGSYGPFQLYAQGELPREFRGNPQAADAWAWSPAGIEYALRRMAETGARGLRGPKAVETIIRQFERPRDPDKSVALALERLGGSPLPLEGQAGASIDVRTPAQARPDGRREFASALLANLAGGGRLDTDQLTSALVARRAAQAPAPAPAADPSPLPGQSPATGPEHGQSGGGSLDRLLGQFGLADAVTSGDRPGAVTARGGASDHGRPGKARDINPRDPDFARLVAYARANPSVFKDFIYSGLDWFIDEGRLFPISQLNKVDRGNHGDHAHVSFR